jgi:hypothetical protein
MYQVPNRAFLKSAVCYRRATAWFSATPDAPSRATPVAAVPLSGAAIGPALN